MKIGDEVIITGISRFSNGYLIGTIGYIIDIGGYYYISLEDSPRDKNNNWYSYTRDNFELSKSQIRNNKLNSILYD